MLSYRTSVVRLANSVVVVVIALCKYTISIEQELKMQTVRRLICHAYFWLCGKYGVERIPYFEVFHHSPEPRID